MFGLPIKLWSSLAILGVIAVAMLAVFLLIDNLRDSAREQGKAVVRAEVAEADRKAQAEAQVIADNAESAAAAAALTPGVHLRIRKYWCTNCEEAK